MDMPGHTAVQPIESQELMYVRCSYCGKWMDVKPGRINIVSHGLCADCFQVELKKIAQEAALSEY